MKLWLGPFEGGGCNRWTQPGRAGHFPPHYAPRWALRRPAPQRCLCPGEPPAEGASLEGRGLRLDREVTGAPRLLADPAGTILSL